MTDRLGHALWPTSQLASLLTALGQRVGMKRGPELGIAPANPDSAAAWIEDSASLLGLETEPVELRGFQLETQLEASAPCLIPLKDRGWLGALRIRGDFILLLEPGLNVQSCPIHELREALCVRVYQRQRAAIRDLLSSCEIAAGKDNCAEEALLAEYMRRERLGSIFPLRIPPGASFSAQLRSAKVFRAAALLVASHAAENGLWVLAWVVFANAALGGRFDFGRLAGWTLILATIVPCRGLTTWLQGQIAIKAGGLLRQRLLLGALRLSPDEVRREGAGSFLGRAIETGAVEALSLSGGLFTLLASIELAIAFAVLLAGAAPWPHASLLIGFTAAVIGLTWRYFEARSKWTRSRLAMTHRLVESMIGHRTRLAQESPDSSHPAEDQAMTEYVAHSTAMDRVFALLSGLAPRLWMVCGLATLAPAFLSPHSPTAALAISIGGLILAWRAFQRLTVGATDLVGAMICWERIALMFRAAARVENTGTMLSDGIGKSEAVIEARGLSFRHAGSEVPVLDSVDLRVKVGDWLLLEGESGTGKSTLASVLAGIRDPQFGLILYRGLDRRSLGHRRWCRRIVMAPQYHDNHVLTGPFAYNLLMGNRWPPTVESMREAHTVCCELGLGSLLDRMPGGMMQMVGETGWQLSHGERSRLFLARALLQSPELLILDESFAALDPETLRQALECALSRACSLIVIAHP